MLTFLGIIIMLGGFLFIRYGGGIDRAVGIGAVGFAIMIMPGGEPPAPQLLGLCFVVGGIIYGCVYAENEKNGTNDRRRAEELQQILVEREEAIESHQASEPWAVRYATEPCPHCGHYKVRNAKWEDKRLSVSFWGAYSTKIGKCYKCEHCGEMW